MPSFGPHSRSIRSLSNLTEPGLRWTSRETSHTSPVRRRTLPVRQHRLMGRTLTTRARTLQTCHATLSQGAVCGSLLEVWKHLLTGQHLLTRMSDKMATYQQRMRTCPKTCPPCHGRKHALECGSDNCRFRGLCCSRRRGIR
jgi:hypothetical protein